MNESPFVSLAGMGLWLPRTPSVGAWRDGTRDETALAPGGRTLDRTNRRRASQLGRALADACAEACASANVDAGRVPTIVGSSIAEASTLLSILDTTWRRKEPVSPAAFSVSVHNAASGILSISAGNRGFASSIAADADTPAAALIEAVGLVLTTDEPVLVACGDETAPAHLVDDSETWELLAAAVVLAPLAWDGPELAKLALRLEGRPDLPPAALPAALGRNPVAGLVDLIDAVARGRSGTVRLDRGTGRGHCAEIVCLVHGADARPSDGSDRR
ncbi:MAG: beta-ketoacyl synthase chain length factor [Planctomycetes bacterium]|nr:beta-ketoacyl synthase chain length factor [Planctomycetota bacterium]